MKPLRFAIIGTGFWARYQLAAWQEVAGAECIALYNRTPAKAEALAREFGIPAVHQDVEQMLTSLQPDFVDVITDVGTHRCFVELAARCGIPVICQKPLAPSVADAAAMLEACRQAGVPLLVHENWRWQTPLRELKQVLDSAVIGPVFRARIDYCNSFPVFENQPFLKDLPQFILADMGTHLLDVARFLFGEVRRLYCQTHRVHRDIQGEDAASVLLQLRDGASVACNMSYASKVEQDRFPEAFVFVEGEAGSIELGPDYWIRVTTRDGTHARRCPPPFYAWADPRYALVHSSIVACHANLLRALRDGTPAETSGEDNVKTLQLVHAAYESAARGASITL